MAEAGIDGQFNGKDPSMLVVGRKSWVAYLPLLAFTTCCVALIGAIQMYYAHELSFISEKAYTICYGVIAVAATYRFAVIRSVKIVINEQGNWLMSGILPWNKRVLGCRWLDTDMATVNPNLFAYLTNSYRVSVTHKFTHNVDWQCDHIWAGKGVAQSIANAHIHATTPR